ncbi:hypothetical protein GCM10010910_29670 [Microbacterium nanhaiense]|uniref:Uncharacterized protein n=1 Tax=Microbacterium nanhaiense TaxID=1301026 RepID=A0ABQ2N5B1_9MICO|nr:hypothetical protein GCM10010910_29670 [Microbacterium nanhaiense]
MFQFPNRSGTSRHGAPVRYRYAVASTTARRSTGGRPVAFGTGNNGPITAQVSSEISVRDTPQAWPAHRRSPFSNTTYTAAPGSESHEKLRLLSVIGGALR